MIFPVSAKYIYRCLFRSSTLLSLEKISEDLQQPGSDSSFCLQTQVEIKPLLHLLLWKIRPLSAGQNG